MKARENPKAPHNQSFNINGNKTAKQSYLKRGWKWDKTKGAWIDLNKSK